MNANLFTAFSTSFEEAAERPALILTENDLLTYGDLKSAAGRLATLLRVEGVAPGDRVAVQVEKSAENVFLYLACLKAGAVYLPLNTAYTDSELDYFFGDAEPKLIVCTPERADGIHKLNSTKNATIHTLDAKGGGSLTQAAAGMSDDSQPVQRVAADLAAILYTSGTTGRSKGAMITHGNLHANAETLIEAWGISSDDVLLHALPIYHVHGLFVALNTCLMTSAQILFHPKFEADAALDDLPKSTLMMGVPTFYTRLLASDRLDAERCRNMRLFIAGSAPLLDETFRAFESRTGHAILERYGMTETGMNLSNPLRGERRVGSVGMPLPGVEARIVHPETGQPLPDGEVGEVQVRGAHVFKGYWKMPQKTAEALTEEGWLWTGDMGLREPDGYFTLKGRAKDLIISGGLNIYPPEVELVLAEHPAVSASAVIGCPDEEWGERIVAVIIAKAGANPSPEEIIAYCREHLARYKAPKGVVFADAFPRNALGKIQKAKLRAQYCDTGC